MTFRRKLRSPLFACTFAACALCTAAFADAPDASVDADGPGSRIILRPQSVDAAPKPLPAHRAGEARGPILRPEGLQRPKPAADPVAAQTPAPVPEKKKGLFGCSAAPSASASGALGLLGVAVWAAARARRQH